MKRKDVAMKEQTYNVTFFFCGSDRELCLLPVLPGGDVAHGSVHGDSAAVETVDYFAHLFPVFVDVFPPLAGSLRLEQSDETQ